MSDNIDNEEFQKRRWGYSQDDCFEMEQLLSAIREKCEYYKDEYEKIKGYALLHDERSKTSARYYFAQEILDMMEGEK